MKKFLNRLKAVLNGQDFLYDDGEKYLNQPFEKPKLHGCPLPLPEIRTKDKWDQT